MRMRVLHALIACGIFLLASCNDENPEPGIPLPEKTCKILKINTPWENDISYTYNDKGQIITLAYGVSLVEQVEATIVHFEYNAAGDIAKAWDEHQEKVMYEYEGKKLVKTKHYSGAILRFVREYIRDTRGNISEVRVYEVSINDSVSDLFRKTTLTYDVKGNVMEVKKYWTFGNELKLVSTEIYSEYDNKKSVEPWYFLPGTVKMVNNPGKITHTSHSSGKTGVDVLVYQYNAEGYPVSLKQTHNNEPSWNFTYVYEDCK